MLVYEQQLMDRGGVSPRFFAGLRIAGRDMWSDRILRARFDPFNSGHDRERVAVARRTARMP